MRWQRSRDDVFGSLSRRSWLAAGVLFLLLNREIPAQVPQPPETPSAGANEPQDLVTRYRFAERYMTPNSKTNPTGAIGQYRVAYRETLTLSAENPQGAPTTTQHVLQGIYVERPVEVSSLDPRRVLDTVRRYEAMRIAPKPEKNPFQPSRMNGLTVWYQQRQQQRPLVLVLTPDHPLWENEFQLIAETIFVPELSHALPELSVHVGDTWDLGPTGTQAVVNGPIRQGSLQGKLVRVDAKPDGKGRQAVIDVAGRVLVPGREEGAFDEVGIHAELRFDFQVAEPAAGAKPAVEGTPVDAPGAIVRLSMAQMSSVHNAEAPAEGRLKTSMKREFILERRLDNAGAPLSVPDQLPAATPENSWLTYVDPQAEFHFRHPQEFQLASTSTEDSIVLGQSRDDGIEYAAFRFKPKEALDPDALKKEVEARAAQIQSQTQFGTSGWQPANEWPSDRKVYKLEAVLQPSKQFNLNRTYVYCYLVLTGRTEGLDVLAMTDRNEPAPFRDLVEAMIRSFQFDVPGATTKPARGS